VPPDIPGTGRPPQYSPGTAPIPPAPSPDYPPTSQFPAVNYAPPGRPPDYGYQNQPYGPGDYQAPPPGYPAYPPASPPRKSNAPLIAVIVAVALLLCGGLATTGVLIAHNVSTRARQAAKPFTDPTAQPTAEPNLPALPTDVPTDSGGKQLDVTYEITGDGPADIIYLASLDAGPTKLGDVKLPWRFSTKVQPPAVLTVTALRTGISSGRLTCRTLVNGREVRKYTSAAGTFATVTCNYFALD
jgi:hypothetical protein